MVKSLGIRTKLFVSVGITCVLLALLSIVSYFQLSSNQKTYVNFTEKLIPMMKYSGEIKANLAQESNLIHTYLLTDDSSFLTEYDSASKDFNFIIGQMKAISNFDENNTDQIEATNVELMKITNLKKKLEQVFVKIKSLVEEEKNIQAYNLMKVEGEPLVEQLTKSLEKISEQQQTQVDKGAEYGGELLEQAKLLIIIVSLAVLIISFLVGLYISTIISVPLRKLTAITSEIAQGNLTVEKLTIQRRDEIGDLMKHFNLMLDNLVTLVGKMNVSAQSTNWIAVELSKYASDNNIASAEITRSLHDIAEGTDIQTGRINELFVLLNQISENVLCIFNNSKSLLVSSQQASELARQGNMVIADSLVKVNRMNASFRYADTVIQELSVRSENIGEFVAVIQQISVQTKILALNAGIEASQTSDKSRGYAVIAQEIRKLAEATAIATKQIEALVQEIQEDIQNVSSTIKSGNEDAESGLQATQMAGKVFGEIRSAVESVTKQNAEVTAMVEQIESDTVNVLKTIKSVVQITEAVSDRTRNVYGGMEEILAANGEVASSAERIADNSHELHQLIQGFKLQKDGELL